MMLVKSDGNDLMLGLLPHVVEVGIIGLSRMLVPVSIRFAVI